MMDKINYLKPEFSDLISSELENGIIYISLKYKCAIHLCACGCGVKTVTPLDPGEWCLYGTTEVITLRPSIGNFTGENPYHAHYYITDNKVEWLE